MEPDRTLTATTRAGSHEEDTTMYRTDAELRRASATRQTEVMTAIVNYRFLAPATLAWRDRLATELARQALLRDGGTAEPSGPGAARRWLATRVVWLGTWLGGMPASAGSAPVIVRA
jgi:hypothetical protein